MIVCIPVASDAGLQSPLAGHFGSTPMFLIADTAAGTAYAVANANHEHGSGPCRPLASLQGIALDAVISARMGMGALQQLRAARIRVYRSDRATAAEAIAQLAAGELAEVVDADGCANHGAGHQH
jgi:predicted Fe-Mo cluster-binding NifX family protein